MDIGSTIKALRERRGWSQEELGFRVQTSTTNISRIETGKYRPGEHVLDALAQEFGLSVSALYALAEGKAEAVVVHLPQDAEARLLDTFRAMNAARRLLVLQLAAELATPGGE